MKLIVKSNSKKDLSNKIEKIFSKKKIELSDSNHKKCTEVKNSKTKNLRNFKKIQKNNLHAHHISLSSNSIKKNLSSIKTVLKMKKKNIVQSIPVKKYISNISENENIDKLKNHNVMIKKIKKRKSNKFFEKKKITNNEKNGIRFGKNYKYQKNKRSILQQIFIKPKKSFSRDIIIGESISVAELANKMSIKISIIIKNIKKMGIEIEANQVLDKKTAQIISEEMGHKVIFYVDNALEISLMQDRDVCMNKKKIRAPVVTIMGHVDHGKTSLLDYIRSTKVALNEAGSITQHIGAYHVSTPNGIITFLDTPGHAAFTSMRARGVAVTDIVVLIVAADDGIMPQTIEAIQHAQSAKVPVIVAINKIDKIGINILKIKKELIKHSIIAEDCGGENIFVPISAKTGFGIDHLLDSILLQAEMLELRAEYDCMASGIVIESFLDKGCGPIATILIQEGTLKVGDIVICGLEYGKIKAIRNELHIHVASAGPSIPVEILGLSGIPSTGDILSVVRNEKKAREVALYRQRKFRDIKLSDNKNVNIENLFHNISASKEISELNIILKADVQGSLEAIKEALKNLSNESISVNIVTAGVGAITESDATLCATSFAILIGFNVRADILAKRIIEKERLDLRYYSVIYNLIDDVKTAMLGLLKPIYKQNIIGLAEVRNVFKSPKFGLIAGCMVIEGIIKRMNPIRVLRNNIVIYEGELESLRRFKEDINEVRNGIECGIGIKNYNNVQIGDIIEVFQITAT
ncbi:translation initiation factor IF-2 [Buchnera aphidicola]|uniref:translation initiation factor IF-2 n=1 Tax=Buchnera aphidicola TaxID=9 RepID=UPI00094D69B5|nr:translation initiation factor IF-2 [Buchnera aphidicola]